MKWTVRAGQLVAGFLLLTATVVVPATPAAADEVTVGPCTLGLDDPHISSQQQTEEPIMRVHSRYMCSSQDLLYVNAEVDLRRCGQPSSPLTCPVVGEGANSHSMTMIQAGVWVNPFTTSDSEPSPATGWYVATAVYEVCLFNGGAVYATGQSNWIHYDAPTGLVERLKKDLFG